VFVNREDSSSPIYLLIHVDDSLIASRGLDKVFWVKDRMREKFSIHDFEEVKDLNPGNFPDCEITRNRDRVIHMSSALKIAKLVESFGLEGETLSYKFVSSRACFKTRMGADFVVRSKVQS
jgi:hypothetical protein